MRLSSRAWSLISVVLLVAGSLCLWWDSRLRRESDAAPAEGASSVETNSVLNRPEVRRDSPFALLSPGAASTSAEGAAAVAGGPVDSGSAPAMTEGEAEADPAQRDLLVLTNTGLGIDELAAIDSAILLENAFLDSAAPAQVEIPEHLRAATDTMGYLVQSVRPLDHDFYDTLESSGALFVAYVPNNAALVRADAETAARLETMPGVRAVMAYAPYFKLSRELLPYGVDQEPLDPEQLLKVVLYPETEDAATDGLAGLGLEPVSLGRTPFGPVWLVRAQPDSLVPLAQLASVQRIEVAHPRALMNDLARLRVGVSTNAFTNTTYLDLSGKDILVNINDAGVDAEHPGLAGRVSTSGTNAFVLTDPEGHGTHVAGTVAGNGARSEDSTNVVGSLTNALFAGMATNAEIYVLPIDLATGPLVSDIYLQEEAATEYYVRRSRTNLFVSNNSWNYPASRVYDLEAASYDAATRDALPDVPGTQPILFVFSAGNRGSGNNNGLGGMAGTISSPATAKNVITVGALEQLRLITNAYYVTNTIEGTTNVVVLTNMPFYTLTDSDNEVASYSSRGNVGIGREGTSGRFKPDVVAPGSFLVSARSGAWNLEDHWPTNAPEFPLLSELDAGVAPEYRYETGTSMAAPVVSGMLALMQEFFEKTLERGYSPALLKALLLHGSRSVNSDYNLDVGKVLNLQGWGLPNLTNNLPEEMSSEPESTWSLRLFADPQTNLLATGESHTWMVNISSNAQFVPFRATLVWTDPPGNPGAAIKLVNDLDLIVSNLTTDEVFYGNYITNDSDFSSPRDTNTAPVIDFVNNVEKVIMPPREPSTGEVVNLSVTVRAKRVNVNTLTANTNAVVQDYALVFSAGEGLVTNALAEVTWGVPTFELLSPRVLTNGVAELFQRAGANFQLAPGTNGVPSQWAFYVFTNTFFTNQNFSGLTNGSNVAILTFLPPNLARPRNLQADIDLYVSKDENLLTLDPVAVAGADKSLLRGGTELLVYTNATTNDIFYIAVKAEDQQAAEFGLVVLSTDEPFSDTDEFGNQRLYARGLPVAVPDGSNDDPGGVLVFAVQAGEPVDVVAAIAEMTLNHENIGDLVGILSHQEDSVTLHNHNLQDGRLTNFWSLVYEDAPSGNFPTSQYSDGPGSLNNFIGHTSQGAWLYSMVDEGPANVGSLNEFTLRLTPNRLSPTGVIDTVPPNEWRYYITNVPLGAVRFTAVLTNMEPALPLDLYLRREAVPTFDEYDKTARIPETGGALTLTPFDSPPLNPGRMFIGVYNPNDVPVTYLLYVEIEIDLNAINRGGSSAEDTPLPIQDDAVTRSTIFVPDARPVVDLQVGLRVDHSRASDVVFHLISPQGSRVLLSENRGGTSLEGYGYTLFETNVTERSSTGGADEDRQVIETGANRGILTVSYDFLVVPDRMRVYYEGELIYDTRLVSGASTFEIGYGPGTSTELLIVVNEGGSTRPATRWSYTASVAVRHDIYTVFTEQTNLTSQLIKFAEPPFTNSQGGLFSTNRPVLIDSFETIEPGLYTAPVIMGSWVVAEGTVAVQSDTNGLGVIAFDGTNFVEFIPGNTPASLGAEITTTRSATYNIQVAVQRNPSVPSGIPQALGIYADGALVRWINVENDSWETVSAAWQASGTQTFFEFRTLASGGPLIDAVQLVEVLKGGEAYFLPEEDLMRTIKAESPYGVWTLEMWDNRVGQATEEPPRLIDWTLNFIFANTNPPVTALLPCQLGETLYGDFDADCNQQVQTVEGDGIEYFSVQVPLLATTVTNLVLSLPELSSGSGDLVLLYNANGLPTGLLPGDVLIDTVNTNGEIQLLTTNSVPALVPGQRYYLGVANRFADETNAFFITAEFDRVDSSLVTAPFLTNGVTVTNTITNTSGVMRYYQFQVSTNTTTHVTFELMPLDGNVDLFLRKATPVPDPLPRPNPAEHDYSSQNTNTTGELIVLTRRSIPVPLDEGVWYLGVLNREAAPVSYTLVAREWNDLVRNPVNYPLTMPATNGLRYFEFEVYPDATEAEISLTSLTGDMNLYVSRIYDGPLPFPGPALSDYASVNSGLTNESIRITLDSPVRLQPGWWYGAVENVDTVEASGTLTVTQDATIPPTIIELSDGVPVSLTIPTGQLQPTYFLFSVNQDRPALLFEVYDLNQEAELLLEYSAPPVRGFATWSDPGDPADPPQIVLRASAGDFVSPAGDWYLELVPSLSQDLSFTIRAVMSSDGVLLSGRPSQPQLSFDAGGATITWNAVDGETYEISWGTDLVNWTVLGTVTATGQSASFTDTTWSGDPTGYYRIRQIP